MDLAKAATAITCPQANVEANWPAIECALKEAGCYSPASAIAAMATVAVETAYKFLPIREMDNRDHTYLKAKKYYPFFGRGFVQITWRANYEHYGKLLDIDLVSEPDRALNPQVAAQILAHYFREHNIQAAADASDWPRVRKLVNGGTNGLDAFLMRVKRLETLRPATSAIGAPSACCAIPAPT